MIILHWVIFTSCWRPNRRTATGRIIHRNPASTPLLFQLCLGLMLHHRGPSHQTPVLHPCMNLVAVQVQGLLHHQVTWSFLRRIVGGRTSRFGETTEVHVLNFFWPLPWVSKPRWTPSPACFVTSVLWFPQMMSDNFRMMYTHSIHQSVRQKERSKMLLTKTLTSTILVNEA